MRVIDTRTGKRVKAAIQNVEADDLKLVKRSRKFRFDWIRLKIYELFKIKIIDTDEIVGLMALEDRPEPGFRYIELKVLELSNDNVGRQKQYEGIAGCLIAHACYRSFVRGYDGYVMLVPKTVLVTHYINEYGFQPASKRSLFLDTMKSRDLIRKYLENNSLS